jgi:transposase-like protein
MTKSETHIIEKEMRHRARRTMLIAIEEVLDAELAGRPAVVSTTRAAMSRSALVQDRLDAAKGAEDAAVNICLHGVTSRKARELTEAMSSERVGNDVVDRIAWRLMAESTAWRTHALSMSYSHLYVNVTTRQEQREGKLVDTHLLVAIGMNDKGYLETLAVETADGATPEACRGLLRGLVDRGLRGVQRIVGDYHEGVAAAVRTELPHATPEWRASIREGEFVAPSVVGGSGGQRVAVNH